MTRIRLTGRQGTLLGFEVSGHAGAGTEGNDLVCAAISFLATTAANALETVAGVKPRVSQQEAYLKASIKPEQANQATDTILAMFRQGALDLELAHPEHVTLIEDTN
ncbi:MAG: ribosomal-processing cysteine protease Prp [Clostridiales bacterium]|nr:ribosomal-processing cysteine protease Prp [Clostridiales bacterium]